MWRQRRQNFGIGDTRLGANTAPKRRALWCDVEFAGTSVGIVDATFDQPHGLKPVDDMTRVAGINPHSVRKSALIESAPPNLGTEKLLALMDSEGIGFDDLRRTLHSLVGLKVHVVGDTIVDTYSYCSLLGATALRTIGFALLAERLPAALPLYLASGLAQLPIAARIGDVSRSQVAAVEVVLRKALAKPARKRSAKRRR